jgi:two-component system sensor histidine kinase ChiS
MSAYNGEHETNIKTGIGLNFGNLRLGVIGEAERIEGTVISDAVNLASRVEGLTKIYGASILITDAIITRLADPTAYQYRILGRVKVKGKSDSVSVFEILDGLPEDELRAKLKTRAAFDEAISEYLSGDFKAAETKFAHVLAQNPDDLAAELYKKRCAYFAEQGVPPDWEGIAEMESK